MRVVGRDRVGDLLEAAEPVLEVAAHEVTDAHRAVVLDARRDVDEHEARRERRRLGLRDRHERRDPAERRADERGRLRHLAGHHAHVGGEGVEAVVAVGRPLALAVTTEIDAVRVPPLARERLERRAPRESRLAATVQEHDGWRGGVTVDVGRERDVVGAAE